MVFERFSVGLTIRLVLLFATMAVLSYALFHPAPFGAVGTLLVIAIIAQAVTLRRFVGRTNQELARFLGSTRQSDYSQSFSLQKLGPDFRDLGEAIGGIIEKFKSDRSTAEESSHYFRALVEHVPVALLSVHGDGKVELLNNAARRLFGVSHLKNEDDLGQFGASFQQDISHAKPGHRKLTKINVDGVDQHLVLSSTQITVSAGVRQLIALQNIQSELDATELSAWQELVRVLTHEIMNSITPVASLAKTAVELVDDVIGDTEASALQEEMIDVRDAVQVLAQRSEGLMHFVQSYRQLTQTPPPKMERVAVSFIFSRLEKLMRAEWRDTGIELTVAVTPKGLEMAVDSDLLDQALINLLRNAAQAVHGRDGAHIWLKARFSDRGRTLIEVADNGPGIDPKVADRIFVPFFTTRKDGSGIGLSLVKQVVQMHGGGVSVSQRDGGGASFNLVF